MSKIIKMRVVDSNLSIITPSAKIICGNEEQWAIEFEFDEAWESHDKKVARFIYNDIPENVEFKGNICDVPVLSNTTSVKVGVYAKEGKKLATNTVVVPCDLSILCMGAKKGATPYINGDSCFIRYSAFPDGTDFTEDLRNGQSYIGIATGQSAPTDKSGYDWAMFNRTDHEKRITNLENGYNDDLFTTDATTAYQKTVPVNALPYAEVESVGDEVTAIKSFGGNKVLSGDTVFTSKFREMTVKNLGGGRFQFDGYTSWQDSDMNFETGKYNKYTFLSVPVKAGVYQVTKTLVSNASSDGWECDLIVSVNGENYDFGLINVTEDTNIEIKISRSTGYNGAEETIYTLDIREGVPMDNLFTQFETTSKADKTDNGGMNLRIYSTYGEYEEVASATLPAGTYNFAYRIDPSTPLQDSDTNLKIGTDRSNLSNVVTLTEEGTIGIYARSGGIGESDATIFYPTVICFDPITIDTLETPLGEDNFIAVEPMGTLVFENEGNNAVTSKVNYMLKGVS